MYLFLKNGGRAWELGATAGAGGLALKYPLLGYGLVTQYSRALLAANQGYRGRAISQLNALSPKGHDHDIMKL